MRSNQTNPSTSPPLTPDVPAEILQVVELFNNELKNVPFPDVSATSLGASLAALGQAQDAVALAIIALQRAESEAAVHMQSLRAAAARGLAYAGIYAATDAGRGHLVEKIRSLELSPTRGTATREAPNPAGKRRGRKAGGTGATPLFNEVTPADAAADQPDQLLHRDDEHHELNMAPM